MISPPPTYVMAQRFTFDHSYDILEVLDAQGTDYAVLGNSAWIFGPGYDGLRRGLARVVHGQRIGEESGWYLQMREFPQDDGFFWYDTKLLDQFEDFLEPQE